METTSAWLPPPTVPRAKNTRLARRLASIYQGLTCRLFPGGPENAYIHRLGAGYRKRRSGERSWELRAIDPSKGSPVSFGSQMSAVRCAENRLLIDCDEAMY